MKDEKNKSRKNSEIRDTIRNIAGFYLIYLAYKMISDIVNGKFTDVNPTIGVIIAIAFAAFGIFIIIDSYKRMKREKARQLEEAKAEAQAEAQAKAQDETELEENKLLQTEDEGTEENIQLEEGVKKEEEITDEIHDGIYDDPYEQFPDDSKE